MKNIRNALISIGVLGVSFPAAAAAQATDPVRPPSQATMHAGDEEGMRERREARRREHVQLLRDALALRPNQEAAWRAFIAAMAPREAMMEHRGLQRPDAAPLTTPQRLDRMAEHMRGAQAEFERHADAIRRFYGVLSPSQQRTFDAFFVLFHRGMGMHGMSMMGMHGGAGPRGMPMHGMGMSGDEDEEERH
jgi:hypothetical protein